jgi:hypothetical protein
MARYVAKNEFASIPRAGNNTCNTDHDNAKDLVHRLDIYERAFMETYYNKPDTKESVAHHNALFDSGLTERGLATARGYAGKKVSFKPGVFIPIDHYNA